jgi:hypothetical protein
MHLGARVVKCCRLWPAALALVVCWLSAPQLLLAGKSPMRTIIHRTAEVFRNGDGVLLSKRTVTQFLADREKNQIEELSFLSGPNQGKRYVLRTRANGKNVLSAPGQDDRPPRSADRLDVIALGKEFNPTEWTAVQTSSVDVRQNGNGLLIVEKRGNDLLAKKTHYLKKILLGPVQLRGLVDSRITDQISGQTRRTVILPGDGERKVKVWENGKLVSTATRKGKRFEEQPRFAWGHLIKHGIEREVGISYGRKGNQTVDWFGLKEFGTDWLHWLPDFIVNDPFGYLDYRVLRKISPE